jgi:hypothetical protein
VNELRLQLESAVVDRHGEITLACAALIQTCCRYERHAQLAGKWLRDHPSLEVETRLALSRDIAKASESRDRAIRALGLDARPDTDVWSGIHDALPAPAGAELAKGSSDEAAGPSDDVGGIQ